MPRFRTRAIEVDAAQIEGKWFREDTVRSELPAPAGEACVTIDKTWHMVYVKTPDGTLRAGVGDWLVRAEKGLVYPVRKAAFAKQYEPT